MYMYINLLIMQLTGSSLQPIQPRNKLQMTGDAIHLVRKMTKMHPPAIPLRSLSAPSLIQKN